MAGLHGSLVVPKGFSRTSSSDIIGAMVGGFLFSRVLDLSYYRGLNLATIFVATIGAIVFLYLLDWLRGRDDRIP